MQYVQVKILQSWKIAAFLVAFFSSFFAFSIEIDFTKLPSKSPDSETKKIIVSSNVSQALVGLELDPSGADSYCEYNGLGGYASVTAINVNLTEDSLDFDCDFVDNLVD